jgi:hypothetical protein
VVTTPGQRPELALRAPETTHPDLHTLQAVEGIAQRPAMHVMDISHSAFPSPGLAMHPAAGGRRCL